MSLLRPTISTKTSVPLPPSHEADEDPINSGKILGSSQGSIIGDDLSITGDHITIRSESSLRIDGTLEADVDAREVVIGPQGHVKGTISAECVIAEGFAVGTIRAREVAVKAGATIEGDVYHQTMSMQAGATFNGRSQKIVEDAAPAQGVDQPGYAIAAET